MARICHTVQNWGYLVVLIGRKNRNSKPLQSAIYQQKRLKSLFPKGKMMYLEFNIRLFISLLRTKSDMIVAIDLDTITPVYLNSVIKGTRRLYDAHELFTEMKEVVTRPLIRKIWLQLERFMVPRFPLGMTVSSAIAEEFYKRYHVHYAVVRNVPNEEHHKGSKVSNDVSITTQELGFILYQGAVNEGRCLEWLIPAMKSVNATLWICGEGNYTQQCQKLIHEHQLEQKVIMKGMVLPEELKTITSRASIGINLVEPTGLNQIYSLANKFFDYIHAGIPQVTMNFPEYRKINDEFDVALLIDTPEAEIIADALNKLMKNGVLYHRLQFNCQRASKELNWQKESQKLIPFFPKN